MRETFPGDGRRKDDGARLRQANHKIININIFTSTSSRTGVIVRRSEWNGSRAAKKFA